MSDIALSPARVALVDFVVVGGDVRVTLATDESEWGHVGAEQQRQQLVGELGSR